jgi:hypothetical protein
MNSFNRISYTYIIYRIGKKIYYYNRNPEICILKKCIYLQCRKNQLNEQLWKNYRIGKKKRITG